MGGYQLKRALAVALLLTFVAWADEPDAAGFSWANSFHATTGWTYTSSRDAGAYMPDGSGLGPTRYAAFECSGIVNGLPCLSNPYGIVEIYGHISPAGGGQYVCAVELYNEGDLGTGANGCVLGIGNGNTSNKLFWIMGDGSANFGGNLKLRYPSRQIKQMESNTYLEITGNAVSGGTAIYLDNAQSVGSSGKIVSFGTSNEASVWGDGALQSSSSRTAGCGAMSSGVKTVTVALGVHCVCSQASNAANPVKCPSPSGTTLTISDATGSSDSVCWVCL